MKSIASSIVVLSGALILAIARDQIPREPLPTIVSVGLIAVGLFLLIRAGNN